MHVSITDDLKKRFHVTCAIRGEKMSQVVTELIEQWLQVNKVYSFKVDANTVTGEKVAK
ncbi:MAG: hypothetical protein PUP91_28680 [Rhizonema sp. PD37]|nr:hypothetical protein [Rhizonema sp. PD37]